MVMQSQTNKLILFIIVNVILIFFLYNIPILNNPILERLCLYKNLFGKECINCGMTRAFLSMLHGEYKMAIMYNWKSIFVFPLTIFIYLHYWYKTIIKNNV